MSAVISGLWHRSVRSEISCSNISSAKDGNKLVKIWDPNKEEFLS